MLFKGTRTWLLPCKHIKAMNRGQLANDEIHSLQFINHLKQ